MSHTDTQKTKKLTLFHTTPGGKLTGETRVPGDKSISHRSIMLGSLAVGRTEIDGFLEGEDSLATLNAFRSLGVNITGPQNGHVTIDGVGMQGLQAPIGPLDLGNSGTSMRLLAGLLSAQPFPIELTGDASLNQRPMKRVTEPLTKMGADIISSDSGTPPIKISGGSSLQGIDYTLPVASAQIKSCLLLAGMYAQGETRITQPAPTRDHTERMLQGFGYPIETHKDSVIIQGGGSLQAATIDIPGDISSAAFFIVGATIAPDSSLLLKHVGVNPTRLGVITLLKMMGADIQIVNERDVNGEPVADIMIKAAKLRGINIPQDQVPLAIDEFPILFIAAACAEGETRLTGARELRVKESDRIQTMADGLKILGIDATSLDDGIVIKGGQINGGKVNSHGDHRIAMSFAIAAFAATGGIDIEDCDNVNTSFPHFVDLAKKLGLSISLQTQDII